MKRNHLWLTLSVLGLLLVLSGLSQPNPPLVSLSKISIRPTPVSTQILLESNSPLQNIKAAYTKEFPSILVVELGKVELPPAPAMPDDPSQFVKDVKIQATADLRASLFLTLKEAVPFQIYTDSQKTVIELIKIQGASENLFTPEMRRQLDELQPKNIPLDDIKISDKGERLDVTVHLGQKAIANFFVLDNPLRLIVDMYDVVYGKSPQLSAVGKFGVEKIKIAQFKAPPPHFITRLVFELKEPRLYTVNNGPQEMTISFPDESSPVVLEPHSAVQPPAESAGMPPPTTAPAVTDAGIKTEAKAGDPAPKTTAPQKTEINPALTKETPPPASVKPAEQKDSAAAKPAETIDPAPKKIAEKPPLPPPPLVSADAQKKEEKKEDPAKEEQPKAKTIQDTEQKYSGELMSWKFKDADLRDVVLYIGEKVGLNVLFDPEVHGSVTCSFEDVPWDQFLDLILKNNKLGKSLEGTVLRIAPIGILAEEEKAEQMLRDAKEQAGPLLTKTFNLSNAKAKDVLEILKNKKSSRGEIIQDDRTNILIVSDVKEKLDLIENLISVLDTQTLQVQIETRIVEATSTFVQNLGIQWGTKGIADPSYGNQTSLQFPNKISLDGAMIPQGIVTKGIGGPLGGYAVNLPAPAFNTVLGLSLANVLDTFRLDVALSALETSGNGRIVSTQRITALNNKEAYINQGRQIPVQTQANFTVTTQYVNAGLELTATPQITAEGTIVLNINIQNNAADFANLVNGIPPITTQSAKTTVTVPDGGTTVIGGIYRLEDAITRERVPFVHRIPILGNIFKNFAKTRQNRELLIFITPRIAK